MSSWEANIPKLVQKFPALYGTRRFITTFTKSRHLSLPQPDQSSSHPSYFLKSHFNIILVGPLLPTHSMCRGLLLHLITINDTHSVGLFDWEIGPLQRPLPDNTTHFRAPDGTGNLSASKRMDQIYALDHADTAMVFHFNIILQRMPGLSSGLLPSGVPSKTLHAPLLSPVHVICPAHLILLIINIKKWNNNTKWSVRLKIDATGKYALWVLLLTRSTS